MKKITWDNPNKMHFESDFKTFNKQTNLISTGNVIANTQYSNCIRPYGETKNGCFEMKPGQALNFDLQFFDYIPECIRGLLMDRSRTETYILYQFCTWTNGRKDVFGYILTDINHNFITDCIVNCYGKSFWKRWSALNECKKYVTNYKEVA